MYSLNKFSTMMFSSLMVVLMLQMLLLQTSVAMNADVFVNPAHIEVGSSSFLDVNCTYSINSTSPIAETISLTVSRGNYTELASITTLSDHQVNVISSEGITGDGVINQGGQSYMHLHWDNPTETQVGTYLCVARGLDSLGQSAEEVMSFVVGRVIVNQPTIQDLMNELNEMKFIQNSLFQEIEENQMYINQLESNVSYLIAQMENQIDLSSVFLLPPLSYNNSRYMISKAPYHDFNESLTVCKIHGGFLAEIDDLDEYKAIQRYIYLHYTTQLSFIYLGGTDSGHDGTWLLPSSSQELPFTDWWGNQPNIGEQWNCLDLYNGANWRMGAGLCHIDTILSDHRYMCEF